MTAAAVPLVLSLTELNRFSTVLYQWTGMIFGEKKRYYLERRIAERMRRTAITDAASYFALLSSDPSERQDFINAMTVNETYFYREDHQLKALSQTILPQLIAHRKPGDLIRIWSLPCSTGEEGYSIAISLLETWPLVDAYNVEIVGSDIDTHALIAARQGYYGSRALNRLPEAIREAYFEPLQGHRRRLIQDLRESVRFDKVNVINAASVAAYGRFDVILCRNLLIYFDENSRRMAAANLYNALNPDGYLCLGHSESMARIDDRFMLVRLDDAIVYRRA